jgi:hypothetical protein
MNQLLWTVKPKSLYLKGLGIIPMISVKSLSQF